MTQNDSYPRFSEKNKPNTMKAGMDQRYYNTLKTKETFGHLASSLKMDWPILTLPKPE